MTDPFEDLLGRMRSGEVIMNTKFLLLTIAVIAAPLIAMLLSTFDLYSRCDDSLQTQVQRMVTERKARDIDFRTCKAAQAVTGAYAATLK